MRRLLALTFAGNVALTMVSLVVLPERVASHFGIDGTADGWMPNWVNALVMTGTHVLLFCIFRYAGRLTLLFPPRWINLPHKEHWLATANRPRTLAKLDELTARVGVAILLFFFVVGLLTLEANLAKPVRLDLRLFFPALGALLLYMVWWVVEFYRAFRVPPEDA